MKSFIFLLLATYSFASGDLKMIKSVSIDSLSNYCPLALGNSYQYYKIVSGLPGCFSSYQFSIYKDTVIDSKRFYFVKDSWERIDSSGKLYVYRTYNSTEVLYMDFNLEGGQILNGNVITAGTENLFGKIVSWKGYHTANGDYSIRWGYGIGQIYLYTEWSAPGTGPITQWTYIMQSATIENDSTFYFSHWYYPEISYVPPDTLYTSELPVTLQVDDYYTNINPPCVSFQFIKSITIESYYASGDSSVPKPQLIYNSDPNSTEFNVNIQLDEALLQGGFDFYYKITAKDKSMFPHLSSSPDSGYYKIVYANLSEIKDKPFDYHFSLSQNYPNPFNPVTKIKYQIPKSAFVTLKVYDVLGNEVAVLVNEEKPAGSYIVQFDGSDLASGVYFSILKSSGIILVRKLLLLK